MAEATKRAGGDVCGSGPPYPVWRRVYDLDAGRYLIKNCEFVLRTYGWRRVVCVTGVGETDPVYICELPRRLRLPMSELNGYQLEKVDLQSSPHQPMFQRTYDLILHRPDPRPWPPRAEFD